MVKIAAQIFTMGVSIFTMGVRGLFFLAHLTGGRAGILFSCSSESLAMTIRHFCRNGTLYQAADGFFSVIGIGSSSGEESTAFEGSC